MPQAKTKANEEKPIGEITHYYSNLEVGIVKLKGSLSVGDKVKIVGATTNFEQEIKSMQIEHQQIEKAKKGDVIGLKINEKVREGDLVYKVE